MEKIYNSLEELIGNTPLLRLNGIEKEFGLKARLLAKIESFNPGGSAKDRAAKSILDDLESKKLIKKGSTIIEPTSGNTGIALCLLGVLRGYNVIIVMPETMSLERKLLMRAYGAELVLTEGSKGMAGAIEKAKELNKTIPDSVIAGQFENPSNPLAHEKTTGPEIYNATEGNLDFFVAGVGTGGTITGVGRYLKSKSKNIKIVAAEPENSAVLSGRPAGAHKIQGIGAGYIPLVMDKDILDEIIPVSDELAFERSRTLAKTDAVLAGISSGCALDAAITVAKRKENEGKTVVVLLSDTGERYLSSNLYI